MRLALYLIDESPATLAELRKALQPGETFLNLTTLNRRDRLVALGYLEARHTDGLVGCGKSATLDAVEAFQRRNGLNPDRDLGGAHSLTRQHLALPVAKLVRAR